MLARFLQPSHTENMFAKLESSRHKDASTAQYILTVLLCVCAPLSAPSAFPSHGESGVQPRPEDVLVRAVRPRVRGVRSGVHAVSLPLPTSQERVSQTHGDIWSRLAR